MTVLSPAQIIGTALPSVAPSSSGPVGGSNIGTYAGTDWSYQRDAVKTKLVKDRKAALARAREKVENGYETKQQRLERINASRDTGSEAERRLIKDVVAKAAGKMANVATVEMWRDPDFRKARETLHARYPGQKLSEMLAIAERVTASLADDPVTAREYLMAAYARLPIRPATSEQHLKGTRGSLQRAQQDQEDMQDLEAFAEKHGKNLPDVIRQLEALDSALAADPVGASARIAVRAGAPAVAHEIPAYQSRMAQRELYRAQEEWEHNKQKGVMLAIQHGYIPGDEDTLEEMAAVMQLPQFQQNPQNHLDTLIRAAKIATHPDHRRLTPRTGAGKSKPKVNAGQKSISGAPTGERLANNRKGEGGIRDSIARVRAAM